MTSFYKDLLEKARKGGDTFAASTTSGIPQLQPIQELSLGERKETPKSTLTKLSEKAASLVTFLTPGISQVVGEVSAGSSIFSALKKVYSEEYRPISNDIGGVAQGRTALQEKIKIQQETGLTPVSFNTRETRSQFLARLEAETQSPTLQAKKQREVEFYMGFTEPLKAQKPIKSLVKREAPEVTRALKANVEKFLDYARGNANKVSKEVGLELEQDAARILEDFGGELGIKKVPMTRAKLADALEPIMQIKAVDEEVMAVSKTEPIRGEAGRFAGSKSVAKADPLIEEARKYKSAEEFVKAQDKTGLLKFNEEALQKGKTVYRGTVGIGEIEKLKTGKVRYTDQEGGFWTNILKDAQEYGKGKSLVIGSQTFQPKGIGNFVIEGKQLSNGYTLPTKIIDANTGKVIEDLSPKTKSQLTDIWNQANKTAKTDVTESLLEEARKYKTAEEFVKAQYKTSDELTNLGNDVPKKYGDSLFVREKVNLNDLSQTDYFDKGEYKQSYFKEMMSDIKRGKELPPIVVNKLGSVLDGNHRLESYLKAGKDFQYVYKEIPQTKSQLTDIWNESHGKGRRIPTESAGAFAGFERDEDTGEYRFNPEKAALGVVGFAGITRLTNNVATHLGEINDPVKKLTEAIQLSKPIREAQESLYTVERAKRVAEVAKVGEKGEAGFFIQLSKLKGELPKVNFEAIRNSFNQIDIDEFFNMIERSTLTTFEKVSAKTGLSKLFGERGGGVPTRGELDLLRQVFPEDLIKAVESKLPFAEKFMHGLGEVLNLPRSIMSSIDLSAPLRQGIFLIGRPKQFLPAFADMFKYAFSEKAYQDIIQQIKLRPTYELMRESKLALTDVSAVSLTGREERFMSNLAEKIPGIGKVFRGSSRAYTGFLNKLRADVFDDLYNKASTLGVADEAVDSISKFVNAATGRGSIGALDRAAPVLNSVFFSPRLIASRLNLLNPLFYIKLNPLVRKEALKSLLTFGSVAGSVLGLSALGGAEVGTDPRSADFGKIKIDNTRYDILGGFQQYIRLASQLVTGQIISSTTGKTITLGEGYKPLTRKDILIRFFESKEAPIASFITALLQGQTSLGEDVDLPAEIADRFMPMAISDMYDLYQENGLEGIVEWLPAPFGIGTQTYGKQELVTGQNVLGEEAIQIRPKQGLSQKISEKVFGQKPLKASKGFNIQAYLNQLNEMPKEDAARIFNEIQQSDPDLAKKIIKLIEEEELGITIHDKELKDKGVSDGTRALALEKEFNKLESSEEKRILWEDYVKKGVITKEVARQLTLLLSR